jgi:membrane protein YqaA with SNARE-associated domain
MHDLLVRHGLPALFLLSFLASTLIPLGSEWLLVVLLLNRTDPLAAVMTATVGNWMGASTTWAMGVWGGPFLIRRLLRISPSDEERAESFYTRYGSWSLLLSWLPVIGDPLCLVGGLLRVGFLRFSLLVFTGKLVRYVVVAWVALQATW